MKRLLTALFLFCAAVPALGQSVSQSGTVSAGQPARWVTNGVIGSGGSAANGSLTGVGVVASGPGICQNSAAITSAGYQTICLGATTAGGGFISVQNHGTATAQGLSLTVNGVAQAFSTSALPTVTGHNVCYSNSTGGLQDCGAVTGAITIGTTQIFSGTTTRILYDNAGVVGEYTLTGSGTTVVMAASPTISAPTITGSFTATGLVTNADLANSATTVNGQTCTLGSTCTVTAVASSITVGTTAISGGTTTRVLYDNAGVVGEYATIPSSLMTGTYSGITSIYNLVGAGSGSALNYGIGGGGADIGGYSFQPTLTLYGAAQRSVLEFATNQTDAAGNTIGSIIFTNNRNTGVGASKISFIVQSNTRNYGGGGANDRSADLTFTAYQPNIDAFTQVVTIGSTDGIGTFLLDTEGPHAINTDQNQDVMVYLGGTTTKATGATFGAAEIMRLATTVTVPANKDARGLVLAPNFATGSSSTIPLMASLYIAPPNVSSGSATITSAASLAITGAPSSGTNKYAAWIQAGATRIDGAINIAGDTGTSAKCITGGATPAWTTCSSITPAALSKTDDTNVTLTLTGTPTTALLQTVTIAAGWSGTLAVSRGGSGAGTFTAHGVLLGNGTSAFTPTAVGSNGQLFIGQTGADPSWNTITGDVTFTAAGVAASQTQAESSFSFNLDGHLWGQGTSSAPSSWTLAGASATVARNTTSGQFTAAVAGAALTRSGTDTTLSQNVMAMAGWTTASGWGSKVVTLGRWVYATVASRARICVYDGSTRTCSSYHSGGSSLEFLTVTATLGATPTEVTIEAQVNTGNTTGVFSGGAFTVAASLRSVAVTPPEWKGGKSPIMFTTTATAFPSNSTHSVFIGIDPTGTPLSYAGVLYNLYMSAAAAPGSSQTFTFTNRKNASSGAVTCVISGAVATSCNDTTHQAYYAVSDIMDLLVVSSASANAEQLSGSGTYEELPIAP